MLKKAQLSVVLLAVCMLAACAGTTKDYYRGLATSAVLADTTMLIAAKAYKEGRLQEPTKVAITKLHSKYRLWYISAVTALEEYAADNTSDNKDKVALAIRNMDFSLLDLVAIVKPYKVEARQ